MSTAFSIDKRTTLAQITDKVKSAGIGWFGGRLFVNGGSGTQPLATAEQFGTTYFVDPQNGSAANDGKSWASAFAAMSSLDDILVSGDRIRLRGVLREQWTAPTEVNNVTLIGEDANPRQATISGVPENGGATWLSPSSGNDNDEPLLKLTARTWTIEGVFFNSDSTANGCVELKNLEVPEGQSSSNAAFINCKFTGATYGIVSNGGAGWVRILNCEFFGFGDSGDAAITSVSTAVALPRGWQIEWSYFYDNDIHIDIPLSSSRIAGNTFDNASVNVTASMHIDLTGGKNNHVVYNTFNVDKDTAGLQNKFVVGTTPVFFNIFTDGEVAGAPPGA